MAYINSNSNINGLDSMRCMVIMFDEHNKQQDHFIDSTSIFTLYIGVEIILCKAKNIGRNGRRVLTLEYAKK